MELRVIAVNEMIACYATVAAIGAFIGAMIFATEDDLLDLDLPTEGRIVLGVIAGLLWPIVALLFVVWFMRAAWRGVMQCVRLVVPAKVKVPKAEVRRS